MIASMFGSRRFRALLLVWLTLVLMPLRSFALASMDAEMAARATPAAHAGHAGHGFATSDTPHQGHWADDGACHHAMPADYVVADTAALCPALCTLCHLAAALPPIAVVLLGSDGAIDVARWEPVTPDGLGPSVLYRPPRH